MTADEFVSLCRHLLSLEPAPTRVEAHGFVALFPAKGPRLHVDRAPDKDDRKPDTSGMSPQELLEVQLRKELEL